MDLSQQGLSSIESNNLDTSTITSEANTLGGREVHFLVGFGELGKRFANREILPDMLYDDIINTAVKERNNMIEEKLDIKIKVHATTGVENIKEMLRDLRTAQDDTYDIMAPAIIFASELASESYFHDLKTIPNMRLEGEWWDQNANKDFEIMGKLYFTTGYISILDNECTNAIMFNKDLADAHFEGIDIYNLVLSGEWTYDRMLEMSRMVTKDSDGETGMTYKDTWGALINLNSGNNLFVSAGQRLIGKDEAGNPLFLLGSDTDTLQKQNNLLERIFEFIYDREACFIMEKAFDNMKEIPENTNVYDLTKNHIAQGKALFRTIYVVDIMDLEFDKMNFEYGILPMPKETLEQESYYNLVNSKLMPGYAIPVYAKDKNLSALVLSELSEASKDTVDKAYYQRLIKTTDPESKSKKVLDIVFNNRVYDLAFAFDWNVNAVIPLAIGDGGVSFVSALEACWDSIEQKMENSINSFKKLSE